MVNVLKVPKLVAFQKCLDKQHRPRSVWSGSFLFAILTSILEIPAIKTNILFENRKRKVSENLEHLTYLFCLFVALHLKSTWRDSQFTIPHFFLGKLKQAVN